MNAPRALPDADLEHCERLLAVGSKSFHAAGRLLPARIKPDVTVLYAFCRVADDLVDEAEDTARGVAEVRALLDRTYGGAPANDPVERAFARLVERVRLPRTLPEALLEGFEWDALNRRYADLGEVRAYSARVAASVGVMMTWLMGPRDAETLARACDLGVAMQLTNIARDVGTDARMGRIYLPLEDLRARGVDPDALLRAPTFTPALGEVVERLLVEADRLYAQAEAGIVRLPPDCRAAIWAARLVYADIGLIVRRRGLDSVSGRASTSTLRKVFRLLQAAWRARFRTATAPHDTLPETRFLVAAAERP
ncbi:MAG: phytoene/squalene synthase family protein [Bradymonadia bacterium]|jgi:phytoene synthase